MKVDCSNLANKEKSIEKKNYKAGNGGKAYIAWEDNASSSSSSSQKDIEANLCFMAGKNSEEQSASSKLMWYLDSGCSKHMIGEALQLINLKWKPTGFVTYGDNN